MANTDAGERMLRDVADTITMSAITEREALQPCLQRPTAADSRRRQFWGDYHAHGFGYVYRRYFDDTNYQKFKNMIKKILKTIGVWHPKE